MQIYDKKMAIRPCLVQLANVQRQLRSLLLKMWENSKLKLFYHKKEQPRVKKTYMTQFSISVFGEYGGSSV